MLWWRLEVLEWLLLVRRMLLGQRITLEGLHNLLEKDVIPQKLIF